MTTAQRNRAIKKMLIEKTNNKSIKLSGGKGSAYGWIHISLDSSKPSNCNCENVKPFYCSYCKDEMRNVSNNIESIESINKDMKQTDKIIKIAEPHSTLEKKFLIAAVMPINFPEVS